MNTKTVNDIRQEFASKYEYAKENKLINDIDTIDILSASFLADEPYIFGEPNEKYIEAEIIWYESMSTNVNDLQYGKKVPTAWQRTANKYGEINSNYGYLIFSERFYNQFSNALCELTHNPKSRRAQMVYTRPSIWAEYRANGKNDFICTNAVTYYVRDDSYVDCVVQMRSNDAWAGYRNDLAWQKYILADMANGLSDNHFKLYEPGRIYWQVMNLHVYKKDFYLIDHYLKTGQNTITRKEYNRLYGES